MISRDFNEDDPDAIGVLDPHLGQSPWLGYWLTQNASTSRSQPLMLSVNVSNLQPDHHRLPAGTGRVPGYLQEPGSEKEDHARIGR